MAAAVDLCDHQSERAPCGFPLVRAVLFALVVVFVSSGFPGVRSVNAQSVDAPAATGNAASATFAEGPVTGLPMPRFVSLKANRVNMRRGPSRSHQVEWVLVRAGLPVEITAEFENWRRIRDFEGDEGWVYHTLLSGRRTVLVAPWSQDAQLVAYRRPDETAAIAARVAPKVIGDVESCEDGWCEIAFDGARGWVRQDQLWGTYPSESVE